MMMMMMNTPAHHHHYDPGKFCGCLAAETFKFIFIYMKLMIDTRYLCMYTLSSILFLSYHL